MAMHAGVGISKVLIFVGAGYTGTILFKNGKLSDIIGELQGLVKGLETSSDSAISDSDPVAAQVLRLAQEVRQLASARQITVLNGSSGQTDLTSLIIPVATLGALGYGYMWWKGISLFDLMYVTKRNMATAVTNLTKHLETVSEALAKTKRHLTQRIENLDGKMDEQKDISKLIMNEVRDTRGDIVIATNELSTLRSTIFNLEDKMCSFEEKQALTLMGVDYLCQFVDGKTTKTPEVSQLQERLKLAGKSRCQLPSSEAFGLQGLIELTGIEKGKESSLMSGDSEFSKQPTRNLIRCNQVIKVLDKGAVQ